MGRGMSRAAGGNIILGAQSRELQAGEEVYVRTPKSAEAERDPLLSCERLTAHIGI